MPDVDAIVAVLAFAYAASVLGVGGGHMLRACFGRAGHRLSGTEAALCAVMPLLALVALAITSIIGPTDLVVPTSFHHSWHAWADMLHSVPIVHGGLHMAHVIVLLCAVVRVVHLVSRLVQMRRQALRLRSLPVLRQIASDPPVFTLDTALPICFVLGILHPRIYVSQTLLERLPDQEQAAMLAHEGGHIRRHDGLWNVLFLTYYHLVPLPGGWALYREWQHAAERAYDFYAARVVGNPYDVASALVEVASLINRHAVPVAVHFTNGEDIEGRCHALLDTGALLKQASPGRPILGTLTCVAAFVLAQTCIHHLVELFVNH